MKNTKIVFMGTPSFAVPILESLIKEYKVVKIICTAYDETNNTVIGKTEKYYKKRFTIPTNVIKYMSEKEVNLEVNDVKNYSNCESKRWRW